MRPDKATLAGLRATLTHYLAGEAEREVPVWRMIAATREELAVRANGIVAGVGASFVRVTDTQSAIGGGSLPGKTIPSVAVAVSHGSLAPALVAERLRCWSVPIIAHISHDEVLLDLRTVAPSQDVQIVEALRAI
jgi:L-seryl-tRNA(Ser) seleniumtransferase